MYLGNVISSMFSIVFISFTIIVLGYLLGKIEIKGVSLGSAGVLVVALLYGVLASKYPELVIGDKTIVLFNSDLKAKFSLISTLGSSLFVTAVGFVAGPKFFRNFNRKSISYVCIGVATILIGTIITAIFISLDSSLSPSLAAGLMTGGLTSTPGLLAAKESLLADGDQVTAGYGIAYLFGVLGVVLFVQLLPKILKVDMEKERENFIAGNDVVIPELKGKLINTESLGLFSFFMAIAVGCVIGSFYIPGINFSLGNSGGCLISGLLFGHFRHIGRLDLRVKKETVNLLKELGLLLFLLGAGVPGGVNFANNVKLSYFIYGVIITLLPMIVSYIIATKVFKMSVLNALGSVTGGMTSTPALGALIASAGIDDVASAYAATYPIALMCIVLASKILIMVF